MDAKTILNVEDEESDVVLLQCALHRAHLDHVLQAVRDGEEAIAYLAGEGRFADREKHPLPALVLLDWNLPRLHGREVLKWLRQHSSFSGVPVIIYTSSEYSDDVTEALALGANDYMVKPSGLDNMLATVEKIHQRWLANRDLVTAQSGRH